MTTVPLRLATRAGRTIPWPPLTIPSTTGGSTASLTIGGRGLPVADLVKAEMLGAIGPVTDTAGSIANLDEARVIAEGPILLIFGAGIRSLGMIELGFKIGLGDNTGGAT